MKLSLFRIFADSMIVMVITACGGKTNTSGLPSTEPALSKPSITPPAINVKLPQGSL